LKILIISTTVKKVPPNSDGTWLYREYCGKKIFFKEAEENTNIKILNKINNNTPDQQTTYTKIFVTITHTKLLNFNFWSKWKNKSSTKNNWPTYRFQMKCLKENFMCTEMSCDSSCAHTEEESYEAEIIIDLF